MIRRSGGRRRCTAAACLVLLAACAPERHYEAALVLQDFAAAEGASRLKQTTAAPLRLPLSYTVAGRPHQADLYLPGKLEGCRAAGRCPRAAILVVPGAVPRGKDDPRLTAFATTLARAGFAVLAPELPGSRAWRIRSSDARDIADALVYLTRRPELSPAGRAGMFAFSYAVGPALLAALESDVRERASFVAGLGGYHDLPRAMRYFTTGWFEHEGQWHYLKPDDTGKMVLLYSSLDYLQDGGERDHPVFDRMVALRSRDPQADLAPLAAGLSAGGQAVYALAANQDPARFPELLERLPPGMREEIARLDLARHDLKQLESRLILVHGMDDNLIPYPESLALAAAVPQGQARVFLIHHVLGHVDLRMSRLLSWRFCREDLPDLWRLWRVTDLLLAQREAPT